MGVTLLGVKGGGVSICSIKIFCDFWTKTPFKIYAFDAGITKIFSECPKIGYPLSEGVAVGVGCYPPSDSEWGVFYT